MKKRVNVSWGDGFTDLFLNIKENGEVELLDYEYDTNVLHQMCGGRNYYCSCSGASGAGYFTHMAPTVLRLGVYRVDTVHNDFQFFCPIGKMREGDKEIEVLTSVPYISHAKDKTEVLRNHPVVVKAGNKVIYCEFNRNFVEIVKTLLAGQDLPEECEMDGYVYNHHAHRTMKKTFSKPDCWGVAREEEVAMEFYNLCSMENTLTPWEFFSKELKEFKTEWGRERLFQLLGVEKLESGDFVRTIKFDTIKYRGRKLEGNPLETGNLTAGWQRVTEDVLVRFYNGSTEAHLVAYAPAQEAHEKLARRLANRMGEGEEFISFVTAHEGEYAEYELTVPKVLFLLDQADQVAEVRKGLARKIRKDVTSRARQWIDNVNDQTILKAMPDDMVITFDDSLDAGNCRPGTEAFVAQYFPGQTQTTAGELKKYAHNYNVMRIFRHLAATGRFDYKVNTAE